MPSPAFPPEQGSPFVVGQRLAAMTLVAGAALRWTDLTPVGRPWVLPAVCLAVGVLALLRVPRRLRVCELGVALCLLSLGGSGWPWLIVAGATFALCLLAPEAGLLRLNGMDRYMVVQDYPGMRVNSHHFLDSDRPLQRAALLRAMGSVLDEVPMARSFIREAFLGTERFHTARPWVTAERLLTWFDERDDAAVRQQMEAPMDLRSLPPWRIVVHPRAEGGWRLIITNHHTMVDGTGALVFAHCLLRRYTDHLTGTPPQPLEIMEHHPRLRDLLWTAKGPWWLFRMILRHVHPLAKVGVKNASLLDDEDLEAGETHEQVLVVTAETMKRIRTNLRQQPKGCTNNHVLLAASLKAGQAWRRARDKPDRNFRVLLPTDIRRLLGLPPTLGNYVGVIHTEFTPSEIARPDLVAQVTERVQFRLDLEEAIETPTNLGVVSSLLPPWLFRSALRSFDNDKNTFFFSYLFSVVRPFRGLHLPDDVCVEKLWGRGAMAAHPGFGLLLVRKEARSDLLVTAEYRIPLASHEGVADYLRVFAEELEKLIA